MALGIVPAKDKIEDAGACRVKAGDKFFYLPTIKEQFNTKEEYTKYVAEKANEAWENFQEVLKKINVDGN